MVLSPLSCIGDLFHSFTHSLFLQWLDNKKPVFTLRTHLQSTVYSRDQHVTSFFREYGKRRAQDPTYSEVRACMYTTCACMFTTCNSVRVSTGQYASTYTYTHTTHLQSCYLFLFSHPTFSCGRTYFSAHLAFFPRRSPCISSPQSSKVSHTHTHSVAVNRKLTHTHPRTPVISSSRSKHTYPSAYPPTPRSSFTCAHHFRHSKRGKKGFPSTCGTHGKVRRTRAHAHTTHPQTHTFAWSHTCTHAYSHNIPRISKISNQRAARENPESGETDLYFSDEEDEEERRKAEKEREVHETEVCAAPYTHNHIDTHYIHVTKLAYYAHMYIHTHTTTHIFCTHTHMRASTHRTRRKTRLWTTPFFPRNFSCRTTTPSRRSRTTAFHTPLTTSVFFFFFLMLFRSSLCIITRRQFFFFVYLFPLCCSPPLYHHTKFIPPRPFFPFSFSQYQFTTLPLFHTHTPRTHNITPTLKSSLTHHLSHTYAVPSKGEHLLHIGQFCPNNCCYHNNFHFYF